MKKFSKKVGMFLICSVCTLSVFAAPKKTADDIAAEIESIIGPVEWTGKANLQKAKKITDGTIYSLYVTDNNTAVTIKDPVSEIDNTMQISVLRENDIGYELGKTQDFSTLNRNDVFITYEGEVTNISHVWMLKLKTRALNSVKKTGNGGISITASDSDFVLKYRGWTTSQTMAVSKKDILQGETLWTDDVNFYTISNLKKGEFSIMVVDIKDGNLSEYQLLHLGSTKQNTITQKLYDEKYANCSDKFTIEEKNNLYMIKDYKIGYATYSNTSVFYSTENGIENVFNKDCMNVVLEALNKGEFNFVVVANSYPFIILNKNPLN